MNLRTPGPTPCPPEVLAAVGGQMINHRGPEFAATLGAILDLLRPFFQTTNEIAILTASGTGGMEAAVVNVLSPGDPVLVISIGAFGDRFAAICRTYGAAVSTIEVEWGQAADPEAVRQALRANPAIKAVLVTHNETSTGVTNPLGPICEAIHAESAALILVDAVSSLGSLPLPVDAYGIDVVVTGSQKGWQVPPGLAMVAMSPKAWRASETARMPRFYFDLKRHTESHAKGQTPWTPALSIYFGLEVALRRMHTEGMEANFARHARLGAHTRAGVKRLGLDLFADERFASNTVTAVKVPDGVDGKKISGHLRSKYGVVLAGGQAHLQGKIFRIGHLGWVEQADLDEALAALEKGLPELGYSLPANVSRR